jgi:hypothetical protein
MLKASPPNDVERDELDRFYREGGRRAMASPQVHYDDPKCPHPSCSLTLEWVDFKLELHGDPEKIDKPLVTAWWSGTGFVGRCPECGHWIHFTTRRMEAVDDSGAKRLPQLPEDWVTVAQIARS